MQTVIDREAAYTVKNTKYEKYPIILIITRVRRNTEILAVIHGMVGDSKTIVLEWYFVIDSLEFLV